MGNHAKVQRFSSVQEQSGLFCIFHYFLLALIVSSGFLVTVAFSQDMEPRAYSRAPIGTNFVLVSYGHQTGDVLVDSSSPLSDVKVSLSSASVAYGHTFDLFGRQANVAAAVSYLKGSVEGIVFEERQRVTRSGLGDIRLRFSTNLIGGPALEPKEFAKFKQKALLGVSLVMIAPTGQYDPNRLVNLGSNRWAFKPEIGFSKPLGHWTLEVAGGVWLFTANNKYFGTGHRQQHPLGSVQGHVVYTIRPKMWVAFDGTYYTGGRTTVNGIRKNDRLSNSRIGATFSYPIGKQHSLKFIWAKGVTARFGSDINSIGFGWQYAWF